MCVCVCLLICLVVDDGVALGIVALVTARKIKEEKHLALFYFLSFSKGVFVWESMHDGFFPLKKSEIKIPQCGTA